MNQYEKYVGSIFDDRYKIIKRIGEGGMAVVFEAFDTKEDRIVAVKLLKEEIANDSQSVKRFINESKAVAMMSHPNIVKIYDVSVKDNLKYIVMEHIDGVTLKSYMMQKGRLSTAEALSYSEQVLRALDHAHTKGVTHRDIKPQNILLLKDGKIKVTDFGIAKLPNAETVTMSDKAIGTVYYISPEQASGKPIDSRSDIYSLGVMMYEMLTGELPFNADSPVTVALMQVSADFKPPRSINPQIPVGLEQIVTTAMQKQPEKRFQSARQMLTCLLQIKNDPTYVFKTKSEQAAKDAQAKKDEQTPAAGRGRFLRSGTQNGEEDKPKKHRYTMFPIILGITLSFLMVAAISGTIIIRNFLGSAPDTSETVNLTVPKLVGEVLTEELKRGLSASGFRITVEYNEDSDEPKANRILEQSPAPGTEKTIVLGKQYTDLKLTLSRGENTYILPDLTNKDYRQVEILLKQEGIKCAEEYEYYDEVPLGNVIRTSPAAGETLVEGDTVTIYISKGEEVHYVQIPQLVGLSEKKAKNVLEDAEIELGDVSYRYSNSEERGIVIEQSRKAFENVVAKDLTIDIVVSRGPRPDTDTTKSEETDDPDDGGGSDTTASDDGGSETKDTENAGEGGNAPEEGGDNNG